MGGARTRLCSALLLTSAVLVCAGGCRTARPTPPRVSVVPLPAGASAQRLTVTDDGTVWITGRYRGIMRLDPATGRVRSYRIDDGDLGAGTAQDLVQGPDRAVYFAATDTVGRIDRSDIRTWPVPGGGPVDAITATGSAVWFAYGALGVDRLGPHGKMKEHAVPHASDYLNVFGIAAGSDGALWLAEAGSGDHLRDRIGRMTTDGRYTSRPLPGRRAEPTRIAAGPDGALWFTELAGHAVGRITTAGAITDFPLAGGLSPYDIVAGRDGALWFTADACIGRITTAGQVTAWPVPGARGLAGIAAAPDGSLWLADGITGSLYRFRPPSDLAPPRMPCRPPSVTRALGPTRATLVYRRLDTFEHEDSITDLRLRISRRGRPVFAEAVPPGPAERGLAASGYSNALSVRYLDGDGEPEVLLQLGTDHPNCCSWTRIYRYDAARRTYEAVSRRWRGAGTPTIRDVNGDGTPEFVSWDDRFMDRFGWWGPIRIWSYRHGVFRDVTRAFPGEIRHNAAGVWRVYLRGRGKPDANVRGLLPAWAAEEYLLGRGATVWPVLERARRTGYLTGPSCDRDEPCGAAYVRALKTLLRTLGYRRR